MIAAPSAVEVRAGDTVALAGGPFTTVADTQVRVDGLTAEVLEVTREGCTVCDACRDEYGCSDDCAVSCTDCVETTRFVLPDAPPGGAEAVLVNGWGASDPIELTVLPTDTDS